MHRDRSNTSTFIVVQILFPYNFHILLAYDFKCMSFRTQTTFGLIAKARFKRRILHAPNAIQTMHNEEAYLIIYCLNCIRCMQNSTFETGLKALPPLFNKV